MVFILKFFILFLVLISFTNCKTHVKSSSFNNISCYPIIQKGKNIVIDGKVFQKTSFTTVIPKDNSVTIPSDSYSRIGNVFVWDRTIS